METGDVILAAEKPRLAATWSELVLRVRRKGLTGFPAVLEGGLRI